MIGGYIQGLRRSVLYGDLLDDFLAFREIRI